MARVMVVEDEPLVAQSIADILEEGGHEALIARGGKDALRDVAEQDFDLLITDILMPEISGWELIAQAHAKTPEPAVIAISGGGAAFSAQMALDTSRRLGAMATLQKPIDGELLLHTITVALRRR